MDYQPGQDCISFSSSRDASVIQSSKVVGNDVELYLFEQIGVPVEGSDADYYKTLSGTINILNAAGKEITFIFSNGNTETRIFS